MSLLEKYGDNINYQRILGNIPLEERQKDIPEEIADNIKYLRRRVEAKHRFLEAEERERERIKLQLQRHEQNPGENVDIVDNSNYVFDNRGNVIKVG